MPKPSREAVAEKVRAYRKRQVEAGNRELSVVVPGAVIEFLDEIKNRYGLRNRGQAMLRLIEQGREAAQQSA
jgi:hypothetical protein